FSSMFSQLFVLLLIAVSLIAADGVWSEWTETPNSPCSDVCGYCGVRVTATRTCSTAALCSGIAQRYEECGTKMCPFPRNTCCTGYIKGLRPDGTFECVVATNNIAAKTKLA
ncbi:hypothetical protein PENTCL1PPCAC_1949, partial [Pristionchus entomophagus]